MTPQRVKLYGWLSVAVVLSVSVNVLVLQPRQPQRGAMLTHGESAAGGVEGRPQRTAQAPLASKPKPPAEQTADTIRAIQRELHEQGFYPGQLDGKASPLTLAAILAYEQDRGLPLSAEPSQTLLKALVVGQSTNQPAPRSGPGIVPGSHAEQLVRTIHQALSGLGYDAGRPDGRLSLELIRAIRSFETDNAAPVTGRVSAALILQLQRRAVAFKGPVPR